MLNSSFVLYLKYNAKKKNIHPLFFSCFFIIHLTAAENNRVEDLKSANQYSQLPFLQTQSTTQKSRLPYVLPDLNTNWTTIEQVPLRTHVASNVK